MKKVEAIFNPSKLEDVKNRLSGIGVGGMMVSEVRGYGRQKGHTEQYRGAEYQIAFLPKVKIEIVLEDGRVPMLIEQIIRATRTGRIGDGKIFVTAVDETLRIRTGERGPDAL